MLPVSPCFGEIDGRSLLEATVGEGLLLMLPKDRSSDLLILLDL